MKETLYVAIKHDEGNTEAVVEETLIEEISVEETRRTVGTIEAISLLNGDLKDVILTDSIVELSKWFKEQKSDSNDKINFITLGKLQIISEELGLKFDIEQMKEKKIEVLIATYFELLDKLNEGRVEYIPSMRSPITWYGGKANMAKDIIPLFPPKFDTYVEAFGGAGSVLFKKSPSKFEIYNDLHSGLYNFFTVLKDKEMSLELIDSLMLTLYSRYEFEQSKISLITDDEVERARKFFVNIMQSFGSMGKNFSTSTSVSRGGCAQCVNANLGHVNDLPQCHNRLENVTIENMDIFDLIDKYDSPTTLFYLDPPYVQSTRAKSARNTYKHEMEDDLQKRLVERMATIKGYVIISGYRNGIYNDLLAYGFKEKVLGTYTERSSSSSTKGTREEMLWLNYDVDTGRKYRSERILEEVKES